MKTVVSSSNSPAAVGPYSQAVKSGTLVFVSGQIPLDPATGLMPESIVEQTRQCLVNISQILSAAGTDLSRALRVGIFLTDMADFQVVNEVYASFFTESDPPARSTVAVVALPKGAKIEIEAVAEL